MNRTTRGIFLIALGMASIAGSVTAQEPEEVPGETLAGDEPGPGESGQTSAAPAQEAPAEDAGPEEDVVRTLTMEDARRLLLEMGDRATENGFSPDNKDDGCPTRAWYYEDAALEFTTEDGKKLDHDSVQRMHIVGGSSRESYLTYESEDGRKKNWGFHTMVLIPVRDDKGQTRKMVFDPAVSGESPAVRDRYIRDLLPGGGHYHYEDDPEDRKEVTSDATVIIEPNSHEDYAYLTPDTLYPRLKKVRRDDPEARARFSRKAAEEVMKGSEHDYEEWEEEGGNDRHQWKSRPTGRF